MRFVMNRIFLLLLVCFSVENIQIDEYNIRGVYFY